jgi:hypothetical protein
MGYYSGVSPEKRGRMWLVEQVALEDAEETARKLAEHGPNAVALFASPLGEDAPDPEPEAS